jgi:hypothetical protein
MQVYKKINFKVYKNLRKVYKNRRQNLLEIQLTTK